MLYKLYKYGNAIKEKYPIYIKQDYIRNIINIDTKSGDLLVEDIDKKNLQRIWVYNDLRIANSASSNFPYEKCEIVSGSAKPENHKNYWENIEFALKTDRLDHSTWSNLFVVLQYKEEIKKICSANSKKFGDSPVYIKVDNQLLLPIERDELILHPITKSFFIEKFDKFINSDSKDFINGVSSVTGNNDILIKSPKVLNKSPIKNLMSNDPKDNYMYINGMGCHTGLSKEAIESLYAAITSINSNNDYIYELIVGKSKLNIISYSQQENNIFSFGIDPVLSTNTDIENISKIFRDNMEVQENHSLDTVVLGIYVPDKGRSSVVLSVFGTKSELSERIYNWFENQKFYDGFNNNRLGIRNMVKVLYPFAESNPEFFKHKILYFVDTVLSGRDFSTNMLTDTFSLFKNELSSKRDTCFWLDRNLNSICGMITLLLKQYNRSKTVEQTNTYEKQSALIGELIAYYRELCYEENGNIATSQSLHLLEMICKNTANIKYLIQKIVLYTQTLNSIKAKEITKKVMNLTKYNSIILSELPLRFSKEEQARMYIRFFTSFCNNNQQKEEVEKENVNE